MSMSMVEFRGFLISSIRHVGRGSGVRVHPIVISMRQMCRPIVGSGAVMVSHFTGFLIDVRRCKMSVFRFTVDPIGSITSSLKAIHF